MFNKLLRKCGFYCHISFQFLIRIVYEELFDGTDNCCLSNWICHLFYLYEFVKILFRFRGCCFQWISLTSLRLLMLFSTSAFSPDFTKWKSFQLLDWKYFRKLNCCYFQLFQVEVVPFEEVLIFFVFQFQQFFQDNRRFHKFSFSSLNVCFWESCFLLLWRTIWPLQTKYFLSSVFDDLWSIQGVVVYH